MFESQRGGPSTADMAAKVPDGSSPGADLVAAVTLETIPPLLVALLVIAVLTIAADWLMRDARGAAILSLATIGYGCALLWTREIFRRARPPASRAHAILAGIILLILAHLFARSVVAPDPQQSTSIALVMLVSGFLVLSTRWLALVLAAALGGWALVAALSTHILDPPTILLLLSCLPLALAAHLLRLRVLQREESWRHDTLAARERAEAALRALRESETRTRSVLEASLDAVITTDEDGVITGWTGRATALFGWTPREAIGKRLVDLLVPHHLREAHLRGLSDFSTSGRRRVAAQPLEVEVLHRDGHTLLAEIALSVAWQGERVTFSAFVRDVTRQRAMEKAMRDDARVSAALARVGYELIGSLSTPQLLRHLCELTAEVLECEVSTSFLIDRNAHTYRAVQNHGHDAEHWAALQSLSFPEREIEEGFARLRDQTVIEIRAGRDEFPHATLLERFGIGTALFIALRRGAELIGVQTAAVRGDGRVFTAPQLRLARGLAQLASLALDNARLFEEAERSSRVKSEFVATMSHELRTPLNVILGYNELLLEGMFSPLNEEQAEMLRRSNRSALQLRELITATLDMSRLEAGRMDLDLEDVDLAVLAHDVDVETQPFRADKPEVELRWLVAHDLPPLYTDRSKLKVILKNLVSNAVKFTDRGSVTVTVEPDAPALVLRVNDTGIGIPAEAIQAIFEPFRQADGSSTRRHGGVGLGLYIVRRLLEMLGGSIGVESEVGRGTTFVVRIANCERAEAPEAITEKGPAAVATAPTTPPVPASRRAATAYSGRSSS